MRPLFAPRRSGCANGARALALFLSCLLFTAALPSYSLSRTPRTASHSAKKSLATPAQEAAATNSSSQATIPDEATQARVSEAYSKLALRFEANLGQSDEQVKFLTRGGGYSLFLTSTEAVMVLIKPTENKQEDRRDESASSLRAKISKGERGGGEAAVRASDSKAAATESAVLRMKLEGANSTPQVQGLDELPGKTNYFIGNDPKMWRADIPSYARVMYRDVYPGIDMVYYGKEQQLEYDFRVAPGADPRSIRLAFEGAQSIETDAKGDLVLKTRAGEVRQRKPVVYQDVDGVRQEVPSRYEMQDGRRVSFHVDGYDKSKPLVIDPVLSYSTFLGGFGRENSYSIAVDAAGNAYVTGQTSSSNFPVVNPIQSDIPFSAFDAFVSKLNADGSALVYSTYLGGVGVDRANGIALDSQGSACVVGYSYAPDFPLVNAAQGAKGGLSDAFIAKLNPNGSALVYSTYLGGMSYDAANDVSVDGAGNAYVGGYAYSHDLPTANPVQAAKNGHEAFRSTDSAANWMISDTGLNATRLNDLAIDPSNPATLYTASELGVSKTTDSGNSWNSAHNGLPPDTEATNLAIDPDHPSTVYLGNDFGIYKSTNSGKSWTLKFGMPPFVSFVDALAVDPVNTSTIYASVFGDLFKSTDGGDHWTNPNSNAPEPIFGIVSFAINPVNSSILYASRAFDGVYKSTDGGVTWNFSGDGLPSNIGIGIGIYALAINPSNPSILYAGTNGSGIYKTTNAGANWSAVNTGLPSYLEVNTLVIDPAHPSTVYAGTFGSGLFKSTNSGATWSESHTGLNNRVITSIAIDLTNTSKVYAVANSGADGFLAKFSSTGARLASTYLGGEEFDSIQGVAVDGEGNSYLTGFTASTNFPLMNPLQAAYGSPDSLFTDAFVTKVNASGSNLVYSTYLGGSNYDEGTDIALDPAGNAYVTGITARIVIDLPMNFPTTPGAFQPDFNENSFSDSFVTKINAAGSNLVYSTYLGGNGPDFSYAIAVNSAGQAFVTGQTYSDNFPLAGPTQNSLRGFIDAFVTRLNGAGSAPVFSTYLGGGSFDFLEEGRDIAVDPEGNIYVTGTTSAFSFPTLNALQGIKFGLTDAFITRFSPPLSSVEISGQVTLQDDFGESHGLGGVTMRLTGGGNFTTTTRSDGRYSFKNLPAGRSYTLTPSKLGYRFSPSSLTFTNVRANLTRQDFTAFTHRLFIAGFIEGQPFSGGGVGGVLLKMTGTRTQTISTDSNGNFQFENLPAGGTYTITPFKPGFTFKPASRTYTNLQEDQFFTFFKAFTSIKGRVMKMDGSGISGVTVKLGGGRTLTTVTDSNGDYRFDNLPAKDDYLVTPMKAGLTFSPPSKFFNDLAIAPTANFLALVSIRGKVKKAGTTMGLSGVTVKLSGSQTAMRMTGADGEFTFANLPYGGDYTVTPMKSGFSFDPPSRTFNDLTVSQTPGTLFFDAMPSTAATGGAP